MSPSPMLAELRVFLDRYAAAQAAGQDLLSREDRRSLTAELRRLRAAYPLDELLQAELLGAEAEEIRAELADYLAAEEEAAAAVAGVAGREPTDPESLARALVLSEVVAPVLAGRTCAGGPPPVLSPLAWSAGGRRALPVVAMLAGVGVAAVAWFQPEPRGIAGQEVVPGWMTQRTITVVLEPAPPAPAPIPVTAPEFAAPLEAEAEGEAEAETCIVIVRVEPQVLPPASPPRGVWVQPSPAQVPCTAAHHQIELVMADRRSRVCLDADGRDFP